MDRCKLCEYESPKDGGWCYMFKHEPEEPCYAYKPDIIKIAESQRDALKGEEE